MSTLLITNIGNRNIQWKDAYITDSFRSTTEFLLKNFDDYKSEIKLQILDKVFENKKIDKVLLFASDQDKEKSGKFWESDTIHEAGIIKKIIENDFNIPCEVAFFSENVTDSDALVPFYKKNIIERMSQYSDSILCDAGGTTQQKQSLKEVAQWLLKEKLTIIYVTQKDELSAENTIKDGSSEALHTILLYHQVQKLIEHFEYQAAALLLPNLKLLQLAKRFWKREGVNNREVEKLQIDPENWKVVRDLSIAEALWNKNYTEDALLAYHIFMENKVEDIAKEYEMEYKLGKIPKPQEERFRDLKEGSNYTNCEIIKHRVEYNSDAWRWANSFNNVWHFDEEKSGGQKSISDFRNNIAHQGKSYSRETIEKKLPALIEQKKLWHEWLELNEENIFDALNKRIIDEMNVLL